MSNGDKPPGTPGSEEYNAQLEWIRFCDETEALYGEESGSKLTRKMKENPFVPIGAAATVMALGFGLWNFRQGRPQQSQYMMRARIAAQGFTIVAILGSLFFGAGKVKVPTKSNTKPL